MPEQKYVLLCRSGGSSSRVSMFAWPLTLQRIPRWKHSGLGSCGGSWQTPNDKRLLNKQHARQFLHMNTWHSHCGWEGTRGGRRASGVTPTSCHSWGRRQCQGGKQGRVDRSCQNTQVLPKPLGQSEMQLYGMEGGQRGGQCTAMCVKGC